MFKDLPEQLQTFYLPQVEQLGMIERRCTIGASALLRQDVGSGFLWVSALGQGCLLSVHDFVLQDDFLLHEYPSESYCLSLMSQSYSNIDFVRKLQQFPHNADAHIEHSSKEKGKNTYSLYQDGSEVEFVLPGKKHCWATTLCFMPEYFEYLYAICGIDPDLAKEALIDTRPNEFLAGVKQRLAWMKPANNMTENEHFGYAQKAFEALSLTVSAYLRRHQKISLDELNGADSGGSQEALVNAAIAIMEERIADELTLVDLAGALYVSKSTLSEAFRKVRGEGVGEHLRSMRMNKAAELLVTTDMSIGEIAAMLGYRHQSSFCNAFKRHFEFAPSVLRE